MTEIVVNQIGTYATGVFDKSAAEISAFDPTTNRLFVVNAQAVAVEVLDLSDPRNPNKIGEIDASAFGGVANSVSVKNGIVAVAIEANQKTDPGKVVFFNSDSDFSNSVRALNNVQVGALPETLTFTSDGMKVILANEGEPNKNIDPVGSVSIIDVSNGVENATVTTAEFTAFNGREEDLRNQGVRIFPDKTASEDFEPESIALNEDDTKAYVTLQENNAIAVVDLETATVEAILPLGLKNHNTGLANLETFDWKNRPNITNGGEDLISSEGETIELGGFSGLWFDGYAKNGNLQFLTVPDRGPNGDPAGNDIPFILPNYQARVVAFELNPDTEEITITEEILLTRDDGTMPITGLPNIPNIDRRGVDASGNPVQNDLSGLESFEVFNPDGTGEADNAVYDSLGADLEGIVRAKNGTFWMVDEYRPSIYHFAKNGTLLHRYIPEGTTDLANNLNPTANFQQGDFGRETLPREYLNRRANRGFEGMALDTNKNILYAYIQTPLSNPDRSTGDDSKVIRMIGINPRNGNPVAEYVYLLEKPDIGNNVDKIGDAVYAGDGTFYVMERDSALDSTAQKFIFETNLIGTTNVLGADFFTSELTGDQEVEPNDSTAMGKAVLQLSADGTGLTYSVTVIGLDFGQIAGERRQTANPDDDVTGIHFHNAERGTDGGVVFGLISPNQEDDLTFTFNSDGSTTFSGIWDQDDASSSPFSNFVNSLRNAEAGEDVELYFNIHTKRLPSGEIRGQIQGSTLEAMTPDDLAKLDINTVNKVKVTNLPSLGYLPSDKPEGLAILDDGRLAVLNDNDFGLEAGAEQVQLGIVNFDKSTAIDPSDKDDGININNWPVYGMYMPDAIASYTVDGITYYLIANEGDDRGEDERVADLTLDPVVFPNAEDLQNEENLGRLGVSTINGDLDSDGDYDRLQSYGTRSFSIIDENGNLVFDSGADFEEIIAQDLADFFNSDNDNNNSFENRSDNKGPEPEGITIGTIEEKIYAFIGLERVGGVMMYDITNPSDPKFFQYFNNRNFVYENGKFIPVQKGGKTNSATGDLAPEGLTFIPAEDSPNGDPLLVVANEVSGTTTIYEINFEQFLGKTDVFLNGGETDVRTEETNLGNLVADAHLEIAGEFDSGVDVSLFNSGSIRSNIEIGDITNLNVEDVSPFNNNLVLLTLTGAEFEQIVEHSVANYSDTEIGTFPQISGFAFSFDSNKQAIEFKEDGTIATEGKRVQSLLVNDSFGDEIVLVENGELVTKNANAEIRLVTLDFLADGGDDYPFPELGDSLFEINITEQESVADYVSSNYAFTPFNIADTPIEEDERIQNLNFRDDTVLDEVERELPRVVFGSPEQDDFDSAFLDDQLFGGKEQILFTGGGDDLIDVSQKGYGNRIDTGSGDDFVFVGTNNRIILGSDNDTLFAGSGEGGNRISTGSGSDLVYLIEDQEAIPEKANLISDFSADFDKIGFANTDLSLENKGELWDYAQQGRNVIISAFGQDIAQLSNTFISDANFVFT